nr:MAG TPA: hypothetical protein [Caudoviricetes sp.]
MCPPCSSLFYAKVQAEAGVRKILSCALRAVRPCGAYR